jgi:hypothetical protein
VHLKVTLRTGVVEQHRRLLWEICPMGRGPAFHGFSSGVYIRHGGSWAAVLEYEIVTRVDLDLTQARP